MRISLTILTGLPKAKVKSGISLLTREFAPIMQQLPILTPGKNVQFAPIHTSLPIIIFPLFSN